MLQYVKKKSQVFGDILLSMNALNKIINRWISFYDMFEELKSFKKEIILLFFNKFVLMAGIDQTVSVF